MIQLNFFGFPTALLHHKSVKISNKAFALLAYLALEGETPRKQLAALLWSANQDSLNNLSVVRGEIVAALGSNALKTNNSSLALGEVQSDLLELQTSQDPKRRWSLCEREFLQGLRFRDWQVGFGGEFEEWLESHRRRFSSERTHFAFELGRLALSRHSLREALPWLEVTALDQFEPSEEAARWWLLTLGALGESARCKRAKDTFVKTIFDAYGVLPVEITIAAFELAQLGDTAACAAILYREFPLSVKDDIEKQVRNIPLVLGREAEWVQIETAWQNGKAIFISGELGIGKSHLALEFVQSKGAFWQVAGRPGDCFVPYATHARCFDQLRLELPNLQLPDWVRLEMARIIPAFGAAPSAIANQQDKLRFFEAQTEMYRLSSLECQWKTLLFEDLQLVDLSSSEAGVFLHSRFLPYQLGFPRSVFVFQTGKLKAEIESSIREWVQLGLAEWIDLQPLAKKAVQQCLKNIDPRLEPLLDKIMRLTGGNPLFVNEIAHALLKHDLRIHQLKLSSIPRAYEIMQLRIKQLPKQALLLARFAAITGEQFSSHLAQMALEWTWQEVAATIEILETNKILWGTRFTHELMLEAILEGTSEALQSVLHLQALRTLEVIGASAAVLVQHAIGANQIEAARRYSLEAAAHSTALFALEDTKTHLIRAEQLKKSLVK